MSTGRRSVAQDPIEQALDKLGSYGVPVTEIGEKAAAIIGSLGSIDLVEIVDQLGSIDPAQIDVGEMLAELKARFDELDPALKVPVAVAAGFVGAARGEVGCPLAPSAVAPPSVGQPQIG